MGAKDELRIIEECEATADAVRATVKIQCTGRAIRAATGTGTDAQRERDEAERERAPNGYVEKQTRAVKQPRAQGKK